MADKIQVQELIDFKKDIIIIQSVDKPHKMLMYNMRVTNQLLGGLRLEASFRVVDSLGKIRYSGDHLNLAVQAYNKLYNGEG
jgi:hypothetical protein